MRFAFAALLALAAAALLLPPSAAEEPAKLVLDARKRSEIQEFRVVTDPVTGTAQRVAEAKIVPVQLKVALEPKKTAIVVCDMWDDHWCKSAASRCAELAKKAEPVLKACRAQGMTIIHCPSDTMPFYKDHPARARVAKVKAVAPPKAKDVPDPPLPVDDSDGGCDDVPQPRFVKAWTRQHAAITIDGARDYISENGGEVYSIMREKGIDTLLVMGVHTNMCVLKRSFAIKQMVKWDVRTFLVRDLTDALYNPKMKPMVTHDKGTQLVIEYIEQHWCPTIQSKSLVGTK
jgi:nicotinamidase-related amidase